MPLPRRYAAAAITLAVHVGLLAWSMSVSPQQPQPAPVFATPVELIELADLDQSGRGSLAPKHSIAAEVSDDPLSTTASESKRERPEPQPRPQPKRSARKTPRAAPVPDAPEPSNDERPTLASSEPVLNTPAPVVLAPTDPVAPTDATPSASKTKAGRPGAVRARASGTGAARDHAAYGAEIERIISDEIDRNPVPGIHVDDTVEFELRLLPSGRLAMIGDGRLDVAIVVRSTVGPLRTRALLRRIKRASARFPRHPPGFPRRHYILGFSVTFTNPAI